MAAADVATPSEWRKARLSLLEKEKEATRVQDQLTAERRALPVVELTKEYTFVDPASGQPVKLADLFAGRPQLIVYHAMFAPSADKACSSCTCFLDHVPPLDHLHSRDVSFAVVSRARPEQINAYKAAMGWDRFGWYSAFEGDFNYDFGISFPRPDGAAGEYNYRSAEEHVERGTPYFVQGEQPGHSVFVKGGPVAGGGVGKGEKGKVYHSYSSYARGAETFIGTLKWLDWTPLGRQDGKLEGVGGLGFRRRGEYKDEEINGVGK